MSTDEVTDRVRRELYAELGIDCPPKAGTWRFTYLTCGEVGICEDGIGLILNVSQGCSNPERAEEIARRIAEGVTRATL